VWQGFFDVVFSVASGLLAIFFGAALGNVIRGVPLGEDGYFFLPLWTNWRVGPEPGILDWYTVIGGVVALVALSLHGALYLAVKTEAGLQERSKAAAQRLWIALLALTVVSLPASIIARPDTLDNFRAYPVLLAVPVIVLLVLSGILYFSRKSDAQGVRLLLCLSHGDAGRSRNCFVPSPFAFEQRLRQTWQTVHPELL